MKKKWAIKDAHTSKVLFIEGSNIKEAVANENILDILSFFVEDCDSLSVTEWGLSYCEKRSRVLLEILYLSKKVEQKKDLYFEAEPKDIFGSDA